jgi:hypothetical protein
MKMPNPSDIVQKGLLSHAGVQGIARVCPKTSVFRAFVGYVELHISDKVVLGQALAKPGIEKMRVGVVG